MAIDSISKARVRSALLPADVSEAIASHGRALQRGLGFDALAPEVKRHRHALGREALAGPVRPHHGIPNAPKYFLTYDELKAALYALQAKYPNLVEVIDIGDSSEKVSGKADRDILALRLTCKNVTTPKPGVLFFGGQHAREIANPALLMRYADWLLSGYGVDPQATAFLESRVIDLIPLMNPDGRDVVARGYTGEPGGDLDKRKSTSGVDGVDLNRNWATENWGTAGTSHEPTSEVYCGPSPASEPEVRAMQSYIEKTKPALVIDWHSFSELVLYPPEDDASRETPDQDHFARVGKKLASYNGYTAEKAVELYPTSGTSMWAYEKLGIPTFTIETGVAFLQSDLTLDDTWKLNFPVMKYATAIADNWRAASLGPEVRKAGIAPDGTLTLKSTDRLTHAPAKAVEVLFDRTTAPGEGIPAKAHGNVGWFSAPLAELRQSGRTLIYVRAMDAAGNWGPLEALWLAPRPTTALAPSLSRHRSA